MSVQDTLSSVVSSRKRKNIQPQHSRNKKQNRVAEERGNTKQKIKAWNFGRPTYKCKHCNALLWCEERLSSNSGTKEPSFGLCCKQGKISLPPQEVPPPYLASLLTSEGQDSVNFKQNIRAYNSIFSFTSMGGTVIKEINTQK
jgi:hypothetical protein